MHNDIFMAKNAEGEYRIAGNFRGDKIFRGSAILRHFVGNIFVVAACTACIKVGKVASFVGKIFVVRPPTTKTTNITRYTVS